MINKDFCLSSYIAYRYICRDGVDFYPGFKHSCFTPVPMSERIPVKTAQEIHDKIQAQFDTLYSKYDNIGILLSGGMDSAILAGFLKPGSHAYTFTTSHSQVFNKDVERASAYCKKFGIVHHLIDITFDDYKEYTPIVMKAKCAPVHSIEPQIYKAAIQAKNDGVQMIIVGESADLIFGGMDQLLSRDWKFDEFVKRYTFLNPNDVLVNPDNSVFDLYDQYRNGEGIELLRFMDDVFSIESSSSYLNAFGVAGLDYYDPYARLIMSDPLDMHRVRNGEPKYLVRETYSIVYPEFEVPNKIPMPRPVDAIFKEWEGPTRPEFRNDIDMSALTGNQKWQLWCAQLFLDINEPA